jgi:hypothetical protein
MARAIPSPSATRACRARMTGERLRPIAARRSASAERKATPFSATAVADSPSPKTSATSQGPISVSASAAPSGRRRPRSGRRMKAARSPAALVTIRWAIPTVESRGQGWQVQFRRNRRAGARMVEREGQRFGRGDGRPRGPKVSRASVRARIWSRGMGGLALMRRAGAAAPGPRRAGAGSRQACRSRSPGHPCGEFGGGRAAQRAADIACVVKDRL